MPSHQPDDGQCAPDEDELHDGVVATGDPAARIRRIGGEFRCQSLFRGVRPTPSILRFASPPVPFDVQGHEVGEEVEVPRQEHDGVEFLRFEGHTSARFGGLYLEEEHQLLHASFSRVSSSFTVPIVRFTGVVLVVVLRLVWIRFESCSSYFFTSSFATLHVRWTPGGSCPQPVGRGCHIPAVPVSIRPFPSLLVLLRVFLRAFHRRRTSSRLCLRLCARVCVVCVDGFGFEKHVSGFPHSVPHHESRPNGTNPHHETRERKP